MRSKITAITAQHENNIAKAKQLSTQLNLPLVDINNRDYPTLLIATDARLELHLTEPKSPGPIYVDFISGALGYRRQFGGGRGQLIAKAVGLQKHETLSIVDLTAGLGRDAFVLASLGCEVTMIERNPIIAALLYDGLERAAKESWFQMLKLTLVEDSAIHYLSNVKNLPDVIYMDPMYPDRKKTALSKKEMRMLRAVVGNDEDAPGVLSLALSKAKQRVVVKRPRLATALHGPKPTLAFTGKSSRFDVYL